jgi:uncharacterized protein
MALIADSGAIYGIYDRHDRHHRRLRAVMERERGVVVVPTAILGEIDYLLRTKLGIDAELDFLNDIQQGAFSLEHLLSDDLNRSRELIEQYRDLDLGLADAAVVATAERLDVRRIMTVDERDFRAIRSADGGPFTLLPADS